MSGYAEYDYDSDYDYYDYDDDYIYADAGAFDLADELASAVVPDAPALYFRDDELEEYDNYNFWSEIEYGNGEIFDQDTALENQLEDLKSAEKKKRSKAAEIKDTIKKIRLRGIQDYPTVLWRPTCEAYTLRHDYPVYNKTQHFTSLLPDWRTLLRHRPALTPASPTKDTQADSKSEEQEDGDWEDMSVEENDNDESEEGEGGLDLQDIDPDLLKSALAAKLSSSGMTGIDQSAFMESMMQMLAGGGSANADDLLESLTSSLLNQVTEGGADSSMGQWLAGQGVSLEEGSEEDEDPQENPAPRTTVTSKYSSPKDSVAADPPAAPKLLEPVAEELLEEEPKSTGKKRKQDSSIESEAPALEPAPNSKRAKPDDKKTPVTATVSKPAKLRSAMLQSRASKTDEKPSNRSRVTPSAMTKSNGTKPATSKTQNGEAKQHPPVNSEPEKPTTRKRKATDEQVSDEKPKRQLRNFAAPTASSQSKAADSKTTRSGRVRK